MSCIAISLRRSKKAKIDGKPILNLPERNVHFTHIDFSPDERQFYEFVNANAQARFNKFVEAGTVMKNYSSVRYSLSSGAYYWFLLNDIIDLGSCSFTTFTTSMSAS